MLCVCVCARVYARACAWVARTLTVLFLVRKGRLAGGGQGSTRVPFTATPSIPTVQPVTLRSTASPCNNGNRRVYTQMHMLFLSEAPGGPPSSGTQTAPQHCTWGRFIQRPRPQKHRGGKSVALRRLRRTGAPSSSRDRQAAASSACASIPRGPTLVTGQMCPRGTTGHKG